MRRRRDCRQVGQCPRYVQGLLGFPHGGATRHDVDRGSAALVQDSPDCELLDLRPSLLQLELVVSRAQPLRRMRPQLVEVLREVEGRSVHVPTLTEGYDSR
jgi:hypothetical protein